MLKEESNWAQACDSCRSAACTVYCRADSAYLCTSCDAQVHCANHVASRHERVRICDSCERAPAAFFCKADSASLCTACNSEIHSANPLARRHHRVPILPTSGNPYSSMESNHSSETTVTDLESTPVVNDDEAEAASWLLPNSGKNSFYNNNSQNNGYSIDDEYLDFVDYSSSMDKQFIDQHQQNCNVPQRSYEGDGVVPLQVEESKSHMHNFQLSNTYGFSEANQNENSSLDPPIQMLSPMDRKARVLRYREKKKMRKFEKTIRYASRKAYAETRPRIKGRFAKRKEVDAEAVQAFSTMLMFDDGYAHMPNKKKLDCPLGYYLPV